MVRLLSVVLGIALAVSITVSPAFAGKGGKGGKKGNTIPDGYYSVQSVDTNAKTFTLSDGKTYKFTDDTTNKGSIYAGAVLKATLKEGSADEVTGVDSAPVATKHRKKK